MLSIRWLGSHVPSMTRVGHVLLVCIFLGLVWTPSASAHQLRMAYLQLNEIEPAIYDVLWKLPARGDSKHLALSERLPATCSQLTPQQGLIDGGNYTARWQVHCDGGLSGTRIRIEGLADSGADALVRIEYQNGNYQVARLTGEEPDFTVTAAPDGVQTATTYFGLGVEHILLGVDHLLFVLALLLIVRGTRRLVATVTAFTLAHSITLAAATLGVVSVPVAPVEAVIALSIVFVASEILRLQGGHSSLTAHAPWLVAFLFGLLHGLGFASALSEIGLPQIRIPLALLFFNLGVEVGQLVFVVGVLALRRLLRAASVGVSHGLVRVPPYAIGSVAMFWVLQRMAS
ncbi:MAG: HupE/UreJ family protein [Onishia taeanensis]|uniref:HupE/UreJ family protein n=1 Tax=Onishia taeanensis TaxID=284577 RepID=UPI003C7A28B4